MPLRVRRPAVSGPSGSAGTGPTPPEQSEAILVEQAKPAFKRLEPDQPKTTVQILAPIADEAVGVGQLRIVGSAVKSATFDEASQIIEIKIVPRFDYTIDFGLTEQSYS